MTHREENPVDLFEQTQSIARGALVTWFDLLDNRRPGTKPIDRAKAFQACELWPILTEDNLGTARGMIAEMEQGPGAIVNDIHSHDINLLAPCLKATDKTGITGV